MKRQDKTDITMKIHPNIQFKEMLENGTAKIIEYKYMPYPNASTQIVGVIYTDVTNNNFQNGINGNVTGFVSNMKFNLDFETLTEPEPCCIDTETLGADLPLEAELATVAAEPEAPPVTVAAEPPPEAPPVTVAVEPPPEAPEEVSAVAPVATEIEIQQGFSNINVSQSVAYEAIQDPSGVNSTSPPPYISFITFNRLGLTIKNLSRLLDSDENFELNIIDCNSKDNSWDYILSLTDSRIKSKIRFDKNYGPIYAINFALSRRKPNQYFFAMDSDTFIKTKNWISRYMEVFEAFPEVGLLGLMRDNPYPRYLPPIIPRMNGDISYLELKNADINAIMDFIPGQLQCLSPKLINEIGYWSEENGFGDAELSPRIVHYTNFKVGFLTTVDIDMTQRITCNECSGKEFCKLSRSINDCFSFSKKYNKNESFVEKNTWKFKQSFQELNDGRRTAYCASIHDPESMKTHLYNSEWSNDNFNHYLFNAN